MISRSRQMLLGLALSGGVAGGSLAAQEPVPPAPAAETAAPPEASAPANATGIVHISDCPPGVSAQERQVIQHGRYVSPTEGWSSPGRRPMQRVWVPYHKFFPEVLTGQPVPPQYRAPMVYMPTDTTQLGYYYQHVPHWHEYTGMIPPVPRPVDWHIPQYPPPVVKRIVRPRQPGPTEFGEPQSIPQHGAPDSVAPPPPAQTDLEKSAATPELIPIPR